MKLNPKNRKWLLGGGLLLLTATPSFALFGIGDIVFDPTSYASLVSQLTTLQTQYTMLKNNIEHFSVKQQWQTTLTALKNANVANMFGETNGMTIAFNTNSATASSTAWKTATTPDQFQRLNLSIGPGSGQPADVPTGDDRDVRFDISGLHHGCRCLPCCPDPERSREYDLDSKSARRDECH